MSGRTGGAPGIEGVGPGMRPHPENDRCHGEPLIWSVLQLSPVVPNVWLLIQTNQPWPKSDGAWCLVTHSPAGPGCRGHQSLHRGVAKVTRARLWTTNRMLLRLNSFVPSLSVCSCLHLDQPQSQLLEQAQSPPPWSPVRRPLSGHQRAPVST